MARRILLLNERDLENPLAGGAEIHTFEVFGRLARQGHEVTLLAAGFPGGAPSATIDGIRVRRLANRYLYYAAVPFAARRLVAAEKYDVVVDVLCKLPFLSPWFLPIPCVAMVHHLFGASAFRQVSFPIALVTWLSEKLIPIAYRKAPFVSVSPSTGDDLVARGVESESIVVIPNGVDHAVYSVGTEAKSAEPLVVWLGRVERYKHGEILLEALGPVREAVPGVKVVFLGDGSDLSRLREMSRRLGLDDVVAFRGFVSLEEKVRHLRRAHVTVNTSEKEGWGLTVIEGNACGTPTIASDVPGLRDSVRDGETGILVPFGVSRRLADALIRVLTDDRLRRGLSHEAIAWSRRFTWDAVADDIAGVIEAAIAHEAVSSLSPVSSPFGR